MMRKTVSTKTNNPGPAPPTTSPSEETAPRPASDGEPKRPDISWSLWTDRVTTVEVAVWSNEVEFEGKTQTRYTCTISRSYRKDTNGQAEWVRNSSFRTHDVPVLCFLLARAHSWMLAQRLDAGVPF